MLQAFILEIKDEYKKNPVLKSFHISVKLTIKFGVYSSMSMSIRKKVKLNDKAKKKPIKTQEAKTSDSLLTTFVVRASADLQSSILPQQGKFVNEQC